MLQVAVHHRAAVAFRMGQSGHYGGLLPEVPGKIHPDHMSVRSGEVGDFLPCGIPGSVIDEDQLIVHPLRPEHLSDAACGPLNVFFLVIGGQND